jgi:hypothetical protein
MTISRKSDDNVINDLKGKLTKYQGEYEKANS